MTDILFALMAFVIMISVIVVIHELGHYLAARMFGLIGTAFSLGFGPVLLKHVDKRGTEWRLSPFLVGGYVSFPGDSKDEPIGDDVLTLERLPRWKRAIVVGAGPGINLVLAAVLLASIAGIWGYPVGKPVIQTIAPQSAAQTIGLQPGDELIQIGRTKIITATDVTRAVILHPGKTMLVTWDRKGQRMAQPAKLGTAVYEDEDNSRAQIGVLGVTLPHEWQRASNPVEAITQGVSDGMFMTWAQFETLKQIVTGERSVTEMSGPIRIAKASARSMSLGLMPAMYLMALISIAVGVMNLMPIPGLDGGHLATYAVEGTIRRDLPENVKLQLVRFGFLAILCMSIGAIALDIHALA
jgi:regulator of sigma E protease